MNSKQPLTWDTRCEVNVYINTTKTPTINAIALVTQVFVRGLSTLTDEERESIQELSFVSYDSNDEF